MSRLTLSGLGLLSMLAGLGACTPATPPILPLLRAISPAVGPTAGGTAITIEGENFAPGATLSFAGITAQEVTVVGPGRITAKLPANPGAWGPIAVQVQNPDGNIGSNSDLFHYFSSSVTFVAQPAVATANDPRGGTLADFNRDGYDDVVFAAYRSPYSNSKVSVHLGDGKGGFGPAKTYWVNGLPCSIAVADFNRDGALDMAVSNQQTGDISVLIGNGQGMFQDPVHIKVGVNPSHIVAGDFNTDQKIDLIVNDQRDRSQNLLFGDGNGNFAAPTKLPESANGYVLEVADWNGDSRLDLAVANGWTAYANGVGVLTGDGKAGFDGPLQLSVSPSPHMVLGRDLDGDRRPELIALSDTDAGFLVMLNDGRGSFDLPLHYGLATSCYWGEVADLNGDTLPDLLITINSGIVIYPGIGKGRLGTPIPLAIEESISSAAIGDLDGDKRPDLVIGLGTGQAMVFLNQSR